MHNTRIRHRVRNCGRTRTKESRKKGHPPAHSAPRTCAWGSQRRGAPSAHSCGTRCGDRRRWCRSRGVRNRNSVRLDRILDKRELTNQTPENGKEKKPQQNQETWQPPRKCQLMIDRSISHGGDTRTPPPLSSSPLPSEDDTPFLGQNNADTDRHTHTHTNTQTHTHTHIPSA
jgi:hypothetical protein